MAKQFPDRLRVFVKQDERLAHRVIAGADMILVPSRFEPCGLTQLYALKYGSVPIVRRTGGLVDTVCDCTPETLAAGTATGFLFDDPTPEALGGCIERALELYRDAASWKRLMAAGMSQDWSWESSAKRYLELYAEARALHQSGDRAAALNRGGRAMKTVRFVMALHNHQPVGNFEDVFEKACRMAYHPFLDVVDEFPGIRLALHYSGPLFEWAEAHDRRLVERVVAGVRAGRFELMGGGFGEPILTMLSSDDAIGQIRLFREHLRRRYDVPVRGLWLTERIWEAQLAGLLAKAGVEYSVVDDFHFRAVGLREEDLTGYYITEDQGKLLRMFSGSEFLRYAIPFREPQDTLEYLRRFATEDGRNVIVYADDGEKFGLWPETYEHVYERGWLRSFLKLLNENRDWIRFSTFAEALDSLPPRGRIYLADASYREMTEWALPVKAQLELEGVLDRLKAAELLDSGAPVHARRDVAQFQGEVRRGRADARADDRGQPARRRPPGRPEPRGGAPRALSRPVQLRLLARRLRRPVHALPPLRDL